MASHRQASQPWQAGGGDQLMNGDQRASLRMLDHGKATEQKVHSVLTRSRSLKSKKLVRSSRNRQFSIGVLLVLLLVVLLVSFFGPGYLFAVIRTFRVEGLHSGLPGWNDDYNFQFHASHRENGAFVIQKERILAEERESDELTERESGNPWQTNIGRQSGIDDEIVSNLKHSRESLHHGQGLDEKLDASWRYWDKDDRTRERLGLQERTADLRDVGSLDKLLSTQTLDSRVERQENLISRDSMKSAALYNERVGKELHKYDEQFEDAPRKELNSSQDQSMGVNRKQEDKGTVGLTNQRLPALGKEPRLRESIRSVDKVKKTVNSSQNDGLATTQLDDAIQDEYNDDDKYDDDDDDDVDRKRISLTAQENQVQHEWTEEQHLQLGKEKRQDNKDLVQRTLDMTNVLITDVTDDQKLKEMRSKSQLDSPKPDSESGIKPGDNIQDMSRKGTKTPASTSEKSSSAISGNIQQSGNQDDSTGLEQEDDIGGERVADKGKKRKRRSSVACDIAFANMTSELQEPTDLSIFGNLSLNYFQKEVKPESDLFWEPKFAGHQSLMQRGESYLAQDQTLHCGFVQGPEGFPETGFGLSNDDINYLQTCHIAVSSCIFGNYDHIRNPASKKVSSSSKKKVCFAMFVDRQSLDGMIQDGEVPDENMNLGLWRIVLIKTLPYSDNRRTGKVPKFLTHRLFPNAKYSIWLDSKLRLQSDPLLILEYFLWRGNNEYAISNHYDRHCVWEEVAQNKKLNKFNHSVIDEQLKFYQKDGLARFNASDRHRLLPSHVPEGSFIVRAHTPMSNLFSCLWFNEVERFTPRDQLSFAYTYLKFVRMNPSKHFHFNMFKDCERKAMVKLYRHKQEEGSNSGKQ